MREKGSKALEYKAIILDEVHERSVESDLVLVCVKQFMLRNNDLRLVLLRVILFSFHFYGSYIVVVSGFYITGHIYLLFYFFGSILLEGHVN